MSTEPEAPSIVATTWPVLTIHERRVLGVLVEKAKTTPDAYPLSINALVTGCNQKSNREPLLNLADHEVEDALVAAQKKALTIKVTGSGRVERWRHGLYEAWHVNKVELAILAELLLRGPQTEGELRSRASRMEPLDDLDALRAVLKSLTDRRLVVYLTAENRRGAVLTHGFHAADELERLRARHGAAAEAGVAEPEPPRRPGPPDSDLFEKRLEEARVEMAAIRDRVAGLEGAIAKVTEQVRQIKEGLGLP
jgi:uncharacterized protein YceH (UPF0502 family)